MGATSNEVVVLRTRRLPRSAAILAGLSMLVAIIFLDVALVVPAGAETTELVRFAVGDLVWRDDNRSGVQDPDESPAAHISVQLLNEDSEVVASTVSGLSGRYLFDDLLAGTYSVRFAGVPEEFRLTSTAVGEQRMVDSDPDYYGLTPAFTLGLGEPNVRPTTAADGVTAAYINPTIDAGITPLRYAVGNRVWHDANGDGIQQSDEPAASATVSLLTETGNIVATTITDATGRYQFSDLRSGRYRLRFTGLPAHRSFTQRAVGADPALDSDPDPAGRTPVFTLAQGAPNLIPVSDAHTNAIDFENQTLNAGLVGAYSAGDTVWRDNNGDGVFDPGDSGVAGVTVTLLGEESNLIAKAVTTSTGRYTFNDLPAGSYKIKFSRLPEGLIFTCRDAGYNTAVDSDADASGMTAVFRLGDENPADTSIDAGLTTPANNRGMPGTDDAPIKAALPTSEGVLPQIPFVGAALVAAGATCLSIARRGRKP